MTYPIPAAALDDRLGWVGTAGSGKTYNAGSGVELILASKGRVIIPDPLGVWWGLALDEDGKRPSVWRQQDRLVIFGGEHGDLPINEQSGALIGETVASMAESTIIDLSGFGTKASERRFMLAFLTGLYKHASGDPVHLVFDEADMWAPQRLLDKEGEAAKLQGMMETVVRRGRVRGFIPWLITQRPAVLSKDVLSQVDGLVAFKLTSSQDRDAIGDWVKGQADLETWKEIWSSLPTMQQGQGVVWVPARGILETVQFPRKATFDSSRTPKRGERLERRDLKPLNMDKLKTRLASIEDEAKANDPRALRSEVARLTRELAKAQKAVQAPAEAQTVVANAADVEKARQDGERVGIAIGLARAQAALSALRVDGPEPAAPKKARQPAAPRDHLAPAAPIVPAAGVSVPQQKILNSLAWWAAFGIDQPTSEQVAFVAGYSASSSGYANLKGAMRAAGLLEYPAPGKVAFTEAGTRLAEQPPGPVTKEAFHEAVRAKLSNPQRRILDPLIENYPDSLSSDALADSSGYSSMSSGFANLKGNMRSLGFIDYPSSGQVRAADWLFP